MAYSLGLDPVIGILKPVVTLTSVVSLLCLFILYHVLVALYNISPLHPLSHIPGPRLAAMTLAYEAYFDLIKVGRYSWEIKRMHDVYGQ